MRIGIAVGVAAAATAVILVGRRPAANGDDGASAHHRTRLPTAKEIAMLPLDGGPEFNRLIFEKSPYLLQHARNPVDWYPWGEAAFERARQEDKPIFLSVGYSTCHWCHVMERESFENEALAAFLNEHFVAIKVDREERPDLDEIYMNATQLMTRHGGWPNSVWLDHDARPWYAGTYFPPEDAFGRPGFRSVLTQLSEAWQNRREDIVKQADSLAAAVRRMSAGEQAGGGDLSREVVSEAIRQLRSSFDARLGGFGGAPKFPPHLSLALLFHEYRRTKDKALLEMATTTLDHLALGGVHDHVGGGFHRYSTDARWFLPHFEKMLYDNAQLGVAYVEAFRLTGEQRYRRTAEGIYNWVLRDMTGEGGGFYSALDADSEGEEGKFYVWTREEVVGLLGKADGELFCEVYGFEESGNFSDEANGRKSGANIPHLTKTVEQQATARGIAPGKLRAKLRAARARLLDARNKRVWPHLDDKVLTAWNGLMIGSLAFAGKHLQEPRYTAAAEKAADFILSTMRRDGRLLRTYRDGEAKLAGYLDDYTFLADGLLTLHETTRDRRWLNEAKRLVDATLENFPDRLNGGFFYTAQDHEKLLVRSKDPYDKAIPSGNGMASRVLLRFAHLTGDRTYYDEARNVLDAFVGLMEQTPRGGESLILTTARYFDDGEPSTRVVEAPAEGPQPDARLRQEPVTVEAFASRTAARPGDTIEVALRLRLDDGWHVSSNKPLQDYLIATTLSLDAGGVAELGPVDYPKGRTATLGFSKEPLSIYEGVVWLHALVVVAENAETSKAALLLKLDLQACNDTSCGPPQELSLAVPLTVSADATDDGPRHAEVFEKLASH